MKKDKKTKQQKKQFWNKLKRKYNHIGGTHRVDGAAFISQKRMREIRWEEAMMNRDMKEQGLKKEDFTYLHRTCHCGSEGCIGVPCPRKTRTPEEAAEVTERIKILETLETK